MRGGWSVGASRRGVAALVAGLALDCGVRARAREVELVRAPTATEIARANRCGRRRLPEPAPPELGPPRPPQGEFGEYAPGPYARVCDFEREHDGLWLRGADGRCLSASVGHRGLDCSARFVAVRTPDGEQYDFAIETRTGARGGLRFVVAVRNTWAPGRRSELQICDVEYDATYVGWDGYRLRLVSEECGPCMGRLGASLFAAWYATEAQCLGAR